MVCGTALAYMCTYQKLFFVQQLAGGVRTALQIYFQDICRLYLKLFSEYIWRYFQNILGIFAEYIKRYFVEQLTGGVA